MILFNQKVEKNWELSKSQNFHKKKKGKIHTIVIFEQKRPNHVASFMLERLECGLQELLNLWSCPIVHSSKQNESQRKKNMSLFDKKRNNQELSKNRNFDNKTKEMEKYFSLWFLNRKDETFIRENKS